MSKTDKAEMINAAILRSSVAIAKKCAAHVQEGTIFYTMVKGRHEVCVTLSDILFTLNGDDIRAIKGVPSN